MKSNMPLDMPDTSIGMRPVKIGKEYSDMEIYTVAGKPDSYLAESLDQGFVPVKHDRRLGWYITDVEPQPIAV